MGPNEDCCICPIPFHGFEPYFLLYVSENCDFSWTTYHRDSQQVPLDLACLEPLNMHHSSNFNAFFPVKSNKMWNFCLKLWFFRNHLSQRIDICSIRFSMPWTQNMWHSSNFDAFFSVKINKMWNFGCFLNFPWQKTEKTSICTGKKHLQRLANLHIQVFGYADHNALC